MSSPIDTSAVLATWQAKLLQLDRRNNLLYFKPGRSTVRIIEVSPDELDERLVSARKGLAFPHAERVQRTGDDGQKVEEVHEYEGDLATEEEVFDLERRLKNLARRDREWQEEQGMNVLFLGAGFLGWIDEDGEEASAPLVLLPCDLKRRSPRDPYRLQRESDEHVLNATLAHKLKELGVDLTEPSEETLAEYFDRVRKLIGDRAGWFVTNDLVLGTFSYSKLAMWQDLELLRQGELRHPLVRRLAGAEPLEGTEPETTEPVFPDLNALSGGRLDEALDPRTRHDVLPADFSQLRAVEGSRSGRHLVIHGPPGTGKSQTIANIIANLLADGRRVLFVSEKTAALDVVKRRLEACGLGVFCLDLHSERGKKTSFYRQLGLALESDRPTRGSAENFPFERLESLRDELNGVVRALHEARSPLGLSVYEVHGRYAELAELARVDFEVRDAADLDPTRLDALEEQAQRIARRPNEFAEHATSAWRPLIASRASVQLPDLVREDMARVQRAVSELRGALGPWTDRLGWPEPESARAAGQGSAFFDHLARAAALSGGAGVPGEWLAEGALATLDGERDRAAARQRERRALESVLATVFDSGSRIDFEQRARDLAHEEGEEGTLAELFGDAADRACMPSPRDLADRCLRTRQTLGDFDEALTRLVQAVGLDAAPPELAGACVWTEQLAQGVALEGVPEGWLDRRGGAEASERVEAERKRHDEWQALDARLAETFSDGVTEAIDHEMRVRYRTDYQGFFGRLFGSYRRDDRSLRGYLRAPRKLSVQEALGLIELVLEVKEAREEQGRVREELRALFGPRYRGLDTDWAALEQDLTRTHVVVRDWAGTREELARVLADPTREVRELVTDADRRRRDLQQALEALPEAVRGEPGASRDSVEVRLASAAPAMERLAVAFEPLRERITTAPETYTDLLARLADGVRREELVREDEAEEARLAELFGERTRGAETDWEGVAAALAWTRELLRLAGGRSSDALARTAEQPPSTEACSRLKEELEAALASFTSTLQPVEERFDPGLTPWGGWTAAPLADLDNWARELGERSGSAADWIDYQSCVRALDDALGEGTVSRLRERSDQASDVPGMVLRRVYLAWIEAWMERDERLRFSPTDHEQRRREYAALDARVPVASRGRVREICFEPYPDANSTGLRAGQLGTLLGELSKRRRQLPVRTLLPRIENLLRTLKPCFLMSPLAVSQYLPRGEGEESGLEFDTVVFDEASQVFPEDAVPAIARARQVIVVGDQQQLPPTDFFRSQGGDDESGEDDEREDRFEGRESILDVMVGLAGQGVASEYLRVHYRSRHEDLIRYSNRYFYEDRLFTFPGPARDVPFLGVTGVYLADGRFDAGRSRTNRREAEEVVERVFALMRDCPVHESIGVVTLSRPQADLIDHLITERRRKERDLDERFSHELDERFFVKNLENVQGDERDHILISIGYGPSDDSGKVANRFGPINQPGGERRLNVAVSRARRSMTVVHSMRAEDVTAQGTGARLLRSFLEFVRQPTLLVPEELEATDGRGAGRFESQVQQALEERGHVVDTRVGVSGYFVDLAVRSEDGARYDLAIECDGPTYYATPSARDRDWLRPSVLNGLGWNLLRLWSTAWVRDAAGEIERIEGELARIRSGVEAPEPVEVPEEAPIEVLAAEQPLETPEATDPGRPTLFEAYAESDLSGFKNEQDLVEEDAAKWKRLLQRVVEDEGPVHRDLVLDRLRDHYGNPRLTPTLKERFAEMVQNAVRGGELAYLPVTSTDDEPNSFLTLPDAAAVRPRCPEGDDDPRSIKVVPAAEIEAAILCVVEALFGASPEDAIAETARQLGYARKGKAIAARLEAALERLVASTVLERGPGGVSVREQASESED